MSSAFEIAAAEVKTLTYKPSNDELLTLYAHFKQGTVGDNETAQPGVFDMAGKAKWNAWAKLKGMSQADAQEKYIAFVKELQAKQ
ncbi:Acyl-CoA-binding domain-containing protein 1 [Nowakowskiella sp. JEL0407]|nr:Acyl-CoA-binding domain-containing protein 1 [Nowakowskiella sp. JEL0407]